MAEEHRATKGWQDRFLAKLRECANATDAAVAAGVTRSWAYVYAKNHPTFKAAWDAAVEQAVDRLEKEAWRRAHDGVEKPVYLGPRQEPGMVTEYSDSLLMFLLKGRRRNVFGDNVRLEVVREAAAQLAAQTGISVEELISQAEAIAKAAAGA